MNPLSPLLSAAVLATVFAFPPPTAVALDPEGVQDAAAVPVPTTGTIRGVVRWKGEVPEIKPLPKPKAEETEGCTCDELDLVDRSLLIDSTGSLGVANIVLTLQVEGVEVKVSDEPVVIDQKGCRFEPHVTVLSVGSKLRFGNSDETQHNVHTYSRKNQPGNKTIGKGSGYEIELPRAETFQVKCDFHPWMSCWIVVTDATHWALTDPQGAFEIAGLPPGTYTLSWWHETLGKGRTVEVTVKAGETTELTHEVAEKKKRTRDRRE